jgi:hypothetical protein
MTAEDIEVLKYPNNARLAFMLLFLSIPYTQQQEK